jgi:hypothetical protein
MKKDDEDDSAGGPILLHAFTASSRTVGSRSRSREPLGYGRFSPRYYSRWKRLKSEARLFFLIFFLRSTERINVKQKIGKKSLGGFGIRRNPSLALADAG